jgi:hypothetical protein
MKTAEVVSRTAQKPVASKAPRSTAVNVKKQAKKKAKPVRVREPDIHQLIQTEAYFRYEKRGFEDGAELQDWLDAERAVRQMTDIERQGEPF